jgi:hypothetical protein
MRAASGERPVSAAIAFVRLEQRLLHQVGGVGPALALSVEARHRDEPQVVAVRREHLAECLGTACAHAADALGDARRSVVDRRRSVRRLDFVLLPRPGGGTPGVRG